MAPGNRTVASLDSSHPEVESLGQEAVDLALDAGLELEPWQQNVMHFMAATRKETYYSKVNKSREHKWACREFGFMVSRQNGKTALIEARILAGLFIWGEKTIIHTAHLFPTAVEAFDRIKDLIQGSPELSKELAWISNSHGQEGIGLTNGCRVLFKARSKSTIRGFSPDTIIFDESMLKLTGAEIKAMMPSTSARPNPQLIFTGSAGDLESEHFGRLRNRALNNDAKPQKFLCWMEWSAKPCDAYCPPDCDQHDDPRSLETAAKANPALNLTDRLDTEAIEAELESMTPEDYARERLGVGDWPADGEGWRVISKDKWNRQLYEESQWQGKFALAVDVAPEASWSCITLCGQNADDDFHLEITNEEGAILDYRPGVKWVVPRLVHLYKANRLRFVVIDPSSPAGMLIEELESKGVKVETVTTREFAQGCGDLKAGIAPKAGEKANIVHIGQAGLTSAVASVDIRPLGDLWLWSTTLSAAEITPLRCATLALIAYKKFIYRKRSKPFVAWS